jgi:glycosyltransferase involved in cell wall biosynthesis
MRILIALTYYRPHYSGLTIYVERLARALVRRGHQVTVLTSQFDPSLPAYEVLDGVKIVRYWVLMRISKGVIMPAMLTSALRLIQQADVVNVHLPQLDAALITMQTRLLGKPVVMTYHCDLHLPDGLIHRLANIASSIANKITGTLAHYIVTNTQDYAENSTYLRQYLAKIEVIPPSVELPEPDPAKLAEFYQKHKIESNQRVIGMLARLATEKGVEYLVQAMSLVLQRYPTARVLYVGQYQNVLGEEAYFRRLMPQIKQFGDHWEFLGVLPDEEVVAFFETCEVTVLPSLNSTESFGMVQIESMSCGTPVVASDLPGVRQPIRMTGKGLVVPSADAAGLAEAIMQILEQPEFFHPDANNIRDQFSSDRMSEKYEKVFRKAIQGLSKKSARQNNPNS